MKNYQIEGSDRSPAVNIDGNTGIIDISGISNFKSPDFFYKNLTRWILAFNKYPNKTRIVNIRLIHINKSSAKWLKYALEQLEKNSDVYAKPQINWYCSNQNEFVLTMGEKYRSALKLPFYIIAA